MSVTLLLAVALAQNPSPGDHYVRPPFAVETAPVLASQYAIGSDAELSIVVYVEGAQSQRVLAKRSDGRGLQGTWLGPEVVSQSGSAERQLHRDSIHVKGDRAFAVWLEDEGTPNKTRLWCNRFEGGAWAAAAPVDDSTVPASHDVLDFACAMRTGPNGNPYVAIAFHTRDPFTQAIGLFGVVSASGGQSFNAPFALSGDGITPGGDAKSVGGVAVDLKGGELHVAWTDDRDDPVAPAGKREVFYRRALLDWFGNPIFVAPLGTGASDTPISATENVLGAPAIAVDDDPFSTDGFGKHVGIGWREEDKGPGLPTFHVRASHDSGSTFLLATPVAHTTTQGVAAAEIDLEILGGRYVATWKDNARDVGFGTVVVLPLGQTEVWRAIAADGTDFSAGLTGVVSMLSASSDPVAVGQAPVIARAAGIVDAAVIAFLETATAGTEIRTSFSDQVFGGKWHIDDLPVVSNAQATAPGPLKNQVRVPRAAYNGRYSNFLVVWQREVTPDTGVFHLELGGYRPQAVRIEGWQAGSSALDFRIEHTPFSDSFAFVLISGFATVDPAGGVTLPDGRRTGLAADPYYSIGLANWVLFLAPNDPITESAQTLTIPLPPGLLVPGLGLSCVGVTWGPGGALHVVTDFVQAQS